MEDLSFSRMSKLDASGPCSETNERGNTTFVGIYQILWGDF